MQLRKRRYKHIIYHLAGIVPVAGIKLDFDLPLPDAMIAINKNYLAVERAVYECAMAGCETIWLVAHYGVEPVLRKRLGDYITDPVSLISGLNPSLKRREIPIFYVPIKTKDRDKRDSIGWSVLHGADTAFRISGFLTHWHMPEKFYCSFPYSVNDVQIIRENRKLINSTKNLCYSYNNKTVKDDLHINFTFKDSDYFSARNNLRNLDLSTWNVKLQKFAKLSDIFKDCNFDENVELDWHYDISSWDKYKLYLSSEHSNMLTKDTELFNRVQRRRFANSSPDYHLSEKTSNIAVPDFDVENFNES